MISHQHKFIFIHIPKCAGTSVEKVFEHFSEHQGRGGQDHRSIRMIEQPWLTINSIGSVENIEELLRRYKYQTNKKINPKSRQTVTAKQYEEYFKFTVVRNPWARAHSWYKNVIKDPVHLKQYNITSDIEFNEFLKRFVPTSYPLRQQVYWLKNFSGKIDLDYIGRFEEIEKVFENIADQLN